MMSDHVCKKRMLIFSSRSTESNACGYKGSNSFTKNHPFVINHTTWDLLRMEGNTADVNDRHMMLCGMFTTYVYAFLFSYSVYDYT